MKNLLLSLVAGLTACASIVNDSHVPYHPVFQR